MIAINQNALRAFAAGTIAGAGLFALPGLAQGARPNIVVIQTDDQSPRLAKAKFRDEKGRYRLVMPNTVRKIYRKGAQFKNQYTTRPVCSPSRASMLSGQYPNNTKVIRNTGDRGGWKGWKISPRYGQNLSTALQSAGYRTAHVGKFLNGYYDGANDRVDTTVPPGWSNWFTTAYLPGTRYYGYPVSDNGFALPPFGDPDYQSNGPGIDPKSCTANRLTHPGYSGTCNYLTDVMAREAARQIRLSKGSPFFLQVDFQGPHGDVKNPSGPQPPTRYLGSADRTRLPRPKNFNERDFSDKPQIIRNQARHRMTKRDIRQLTRIYRKQVETLRGVDDGVGAILKTLRRTGQLKNTYVFFTSDHGYFLGEHRYKEGKFMPYDEAATVPMAVRGPDIRPRTRVREVTANIDIAPTALKLAGVRPGYKVDGRSLRPFWRNPGKRTRRPVGISLGIVRDTTSSASISAKAPVEQYDGFRVGRYKYIAYKAGGEELYDLKRDPFEMKNRINSRRYRAVRRYMQSHLAEVSNCGGSQCRAELPPWPRPRS